MRQTITSNSFVLCVNRTKRTKKENEMTASFSFFLFFKFNHLRNKVPLFLLEWNAEGKGESIISTIYEIIPDSVSKFLD